MFELWLTSAGVLLFLAIVFALAEVCVRVDGRAREKRKVRKAPIPRISLQRFIRDGGLQWIDAPKRGDARR